MLSKERGQPECLALLGIAVQALASARAQGVKGEIAWRTPRLADECARRTPRDGRLGADVTSSVSSSHRPQPS